MGIPAVVGNGQQTATCFHRWRTTQSDFGRHEHALLTTLAACMAGGGISDLEICGKEDGRRSREIRGVRSTRAWRWGIREGNLDEEKLCYSLFSISGSDIPFLHLLAAGGLLNVQSQLKSSQLKEAVPHAFGSF